MSGQERPTRPRLASLSTGKALSLDSLPHDTQSRGAGVLWGKSCHARPAHAMPAIASSGSTRRRRKPPQRQQWKKASKSPSSHKTEQMSSPEKGTAWDKTFIAFQKALRANHDNCSCVVDAQLCQLFVAGEHLLLSNLPHRFIAASASSAAATLVADLRPECVRHINGFVGIAPSASSTAAATAADLRPEFVLRNSGFAAAAASASSAAAATAADLRPEFVLRNSGFATAAASASSAAAAATAADLRPELVLRNSGLAPPAPNGDSISCA
eukprot:113183-Pelagomonas_calceolata.AAC.1